MARRHITPNTLTPDTKITREEVWKMRLKD